MHISVLPDEFANAVLVGGKPNSLKPTRFGQEKQVYLSRGFDLKTLLVTITTKHLKKRTAVHCLLQNSNTTLKELR